MTSLKASFSSPHHDARRTNASNGDLHALITNFTNLTMESGSSPFDALMAFGRSSHKPFAIKFLSETLKEPKYIRGAGFFGHTVNQIDRLVRQYPYLRWWIEKEGLVVDQPPAELGPISDFDRLAGALFIEHASPGKLTRASLLLIARELDSAA
jgi:hypothetical protein